MTLPDHSRGQPGPWAGSDSSLVPIPSSKVRRHRSVEIVEWRSPPRHQAAQSLDIRNSLTSAQVRPSLCTQGSCGILLRRATERSIGLPGTDHRHTGQLQRPHRARAKELETMCQFRAPGSEPEYA